MLHDQVERKFVKSYNIEDYEVLTSTGWEPVSQIHQTIEYQVWGIVLQNGFRLFAADDHILIDVNGNEIFLKDCVVGETVIQTMEGPYLVQAVQIFGENVNMYDLSVESPDHTYYTNGILSHNTTTAVALILHYILFNKHKTVAVLANKGAGAREIISRLRLAYEALPKWLQRGVKEWNKGSIELENGCKVVSGTTTSSSLRGVSCVAGNTMVCVEDDDGDIYYIDIKSAFVNINKIDRVKQIDPMKKKIYTVYQITNLVNSKIYIGLHSIAEDMKYTVFSDSGSAYEDGYLGSGKLIGKAVAKYGPENFAQEILGVFETLEEANELERQLVDREFTLRKDTYNMAIGGEARIMFGDNNPFYGRTHSDQTKTKISESRQSNESRSWCELIHYESGEIFRTYSEALTYLHMSTAEKMDNVHQYIAAGIIGYTKTDGYLREVAEKQFMKYKDWIDTKDHRHAEMSRRCKERFLGTVQSEDHVEKRVIAAKKFRQDNPEFQKQWMDKINKNPEKIAKTAAKHRGMKRSPEAVENIRQAQLKMRWFNDGVNQSRRQQCPDGWVEGKLS